jgi:hypothetical protein
VAEAIRAVWQCVKTNFSDMSGECKAALGKIVPWQNSSADPKEAALGALALVANTYARDYPGPTLAPVTAQPNLAPQLASASGPVIIVVSVLLVSALAVGA